MKSSVEATQNTENNNHQQNNIGHVYSQQQTQLLPKFDNNSESSETPSETINSQLKAVIDERNSIVSKKQIILSYMDQSSHFKGQSQPLIKNSSAPILNFRQPRDAKDLGTQQKQNDKQQQFIKTEKKLPQIKDNRLYFHYSSSKQARDVKPQLQNKNIMKSRMVSKRKSEGFQESHHLNEHNLQSNQRFGRFAKGRNSESLQTSLKEIDFAQVNTQDEESRVFQRFLKTFSTNNWSEFANKVLVNDKNQNRDNLSTAQIQGKPHKNASRNSNIVSPMQHSAAYNSSGNNINHYINTFGSFKQYQWQKLNFDFNTNRAPQTIKHMVQQCQVQQDQKALRHSIEQENTLSIVDEQHSKGAFLTEMGADETYAKDSFNEQKQASQSNNRALIKHIPSRQQLGNNRNLTTQQPYKHETRYQKFKKESEIVQLNSSLKQLNLLQQIGSVNILKEYRYPGSVEEIVKFIKDKDLDLYEKILQTKNMAKKRIDANPQMDSSTQGPLGGGGSIIFSNQKYSIKEKEFARLFTMNERQQVVVLKEWLDYMIEHYVKYDGQMSTKRLQNEQLILAFTLSDLKDQMTVECTERGEIMEKVLALVFDLFKCYESSFEVIIQEEVNQYKQILQVQLANKDEILKKKDKQLVKAQSQIQEHEQVLQQKDYSINALIAKNKGLEVRFKVMKNLIDNLIFSYKQRISQDFEKSKLERHLARNFVQQLKELKKYGQKSDADVGTGDEDDMLMGLSDEERIKESLKRKVDKPTQTENISALFSSLYTVKSLTMKQTTATSHDTKIKQSREAKNNKQITMKEKQDYIVQKTYGSISEGSEGQDVEPEKDEKDDSISVQLGNEGEGAHIQVQDDYSQSFSQNNEENFNKEEEEEVKIDNKDHSSADHTDDKQLSQDKLDSNLNLEDSDINTDDEYLRAKEQQEDLEETIRLQRQREAMLEVIDQYSPDMLLEIIDFYNAKMQNFTEQVGVQTEDVILSPLRLRSPSFRKTAEKVILTKKVISNFSQSSNSHGLSNELTLIPQHSSPNEQFDKKSIQLISAKSDNSSIMKQDKSGGASGVMRRNTVFAGIKTASSATSSPGKKGSLSIASDEELSSSPLGKFSSQSRLNVDDIIKELSNLDINDLNQLLSTEKQYNKVSMSFLQTLVQQLKKTQQFKHLVDKAAKDQLRGSQDKEKQKHEKQILKSSSKMGSKSKTQKHLLKSSTTAQNAIIEETSSSSGESGGESTGRKQLKSSSTKNLGQKKASIGQNGGSSSRKNKNKVVLKQNARNMVEKATQYEVSNEEYERIKRAYMDEIVHKREANSINNSSLHPNNEQDSPIVLSHRIEVEPLNIKSTELNESSSKKKLKHIAHLVGRMSIAFSNKTNLLGGEKGITPKSSILIPSGAAQTLFAPFNLGQERQSKAKQNTHAMGKFLPLFLEKYKANNKAFFNVNQMTVKLVLKMIIQFYYDKVTLAKESSYIKSQTIGEFLYDQLFNKYGIANITEKKIKELLMSVMIYRTTNLTASLFAKFMMLEDDTFSNDDLGFMFRLNKRFVQNPNIVFQVAFDVLSAYLQMKLTPKSLLKFQEDLKLKLKEFVIVQQQNGVILIATERFIEAMINGYQYVKFLIFEQLRKKLDLAALDDDLYPQVLQERQFDCDTFLKILATYNDKGQLEKENPYQLFEANRVFISGNQATTAIKDDEKRISLESVISIIFKFDLIIV